MAKFAIAWSSEILPCGTGLIVFTGHGGDGSCGNLDGALMRAAIRSVLATMQPIGLIVDLSSFEYRFGDWIASVPLAAVPTLGIGRVCVVAGGETAAALNRLWEVSRLGSAVLLFGNLVEALRYLSMPTDF